MVQPVDYSFSFPCFTPMVTPNDPHTFSTDGVQCIIIATDYDILDEVFRTGLRHIKLQMRAQFETPESLLNWLEGIEERMVRGRRVTHVLVDPKGDNVKWNAPLSEFIKQLAAVIDANH